MIRYRSTSSSNDNYLGIFVGVFVSLTLVLTDVGALIDKHGRVVPVSHVRIGYGSARQKELKIVESKSFKISSQAMDSKYTVDCIVVIVLQRPVNERHVKIATLATSRPAPNTICKTVGWDETRDRYTEVLVEIGASILDDTKCQNFYGELDTFFCTKPNEKEDLCFWDTGAPLICGDVVSGISYFPGCANASVPSLWNAVVDQQDFIKGVFNQPQDPKEQTSGTRLFSSTKLIEILILVYLNA